MKFVTNRKKPHFQEGFTAIELLITLFIAAAFLIAGYQLYLVAIKDGAATRQQTLAAQVAYNYLRKYSAGNVAQPCSASTPVNNQSITVSGLANVTVLVTISCPYTTGTTPLPNLSEVTATVNYGVNSPQQKVVYSTYVNGTSQ